jgi:hypothetical protein
LQHSLLIRSIRSLSQEHNETTSNVLQHELSSSILWDLHFTSLENPKMSTRRRITKLINATIETPWIAPMSERPTSSRARSGLDNGPRDNSVPDATIAAFSPNQQTATRHRNRAVVIHQKSPLLVSTPPQITRALAYSHPFILPLNALAGLVTWTTGDPWESFLFVASFWFITLYLDTILRWTGPLVAIGLIVVGMHSRKYNPLSSTNWSSSLEKGRRRSSSTTSSNALPPRKSLDEILETLRVFTNRCDVLMDPFIQFTEFLGTQTSATSALSRPALTSLFLRLMAITPLWIILALPYIGIITTTRVTLIIGTIGLTWHSVPARVSRTILWRSHSIRYLASLATGLQLTHHAGLTIPPGAAYHTDSAVARSLQKPASGDLQEAKAEGVSFTFAIYENQRRWVGLGFTANLLPAERQAWTEEHGNTCADLQHFTLPSTNSDTIQWRWVEGSEWRVDPSWTDDTSNPSSSSPSPPSDTKTTSATPASGEGWIYYDNKWRGGSKSDDTWTKWTRRRRWIRDAALVEVVPTLDPAHPDQSPAPLSPVATGRDLPSSAPARARTTSSSTTTPTAKKGWFGKNNNANNTTTAKSSNTKSDIDPDDSALSAASSSDVEKSSAKNRRLRTEEDVHTPLRFREEGIDRSIGDGLAEGLS